MLTRVAALVALFAVVPAAVAQVAQVPAERYQAGKQYFVIESAPSGGSGPVEVVEVFSYACPACAMFQPQTEKWLKSKPVQTSFSYLPAEFHSTWEPFARAYFAAEALGVREKNHQALFNAVHVEHKPLATIEQIADFYAEHGVKREDFLATAKSFSVETQLKRARALVPRMGVDATPSVVVAGKYRVNGKSADGYEKVYDVVNFLIAKEAAARASAKPAAP